MLGLKEGGIGGEGGGAGMKRLVCSKLAIIMVFPIPTEMEVSAAHMSLCYNTHSLTKRNRRDICNQ